MLCMVSIQGTILINFMRLRNVWIYLMKWLNISASLRRTIFINFQNLLLIIQFGILEKKKKQLFHICHYKSFPSSEQFYRFKEYIKKFNRTLFWVHVLFWDNPPYAFKFLPVKMFSLLNLLKNTENDSIKQKMHYFLVFYLLFMNLYI